MSIPKSKKQLFEEAKAERLIEQFDEITGHRLHLSAALHELDPKDIPGSYKNTLKALVMNAGHNGIALSLVKEVLPDPEILQQVRGELGTGPYVVGKGTPAEHVAEGEKVIIEGKGQTKGNTVTFYPGENMKIISPEAQAPASESTTTE